VADFGLAKTEGTEALTHAGDIVGTLRYMAPERIRGLAEPRSDVYALGLTLYEMLTLQPAFAAEDRARLIDRILHDEPSRPRHLDPRIPHDLETICLKAMARDPSDRYRTAPELAEDLRRYLSDRPILARRASTVEQARRWCRRNPGVAGMAGAVLIVLVAAVIILSIANLRIRRERNAKDGALKLARANEELATGQRARAERHLADAAQVVDRMLTRVADEKLASVPQMEGLRKQLLEDAVQFYEEFLRQNRGNRSLQLETAKAHSRLSRLFHHLGDYRAVGDLSRQAIASLEGLLAEDPTRVEVRVELAEALSWRGQSFLFRDDHSERGIRESEECLRRYVAIYEQLTAQFPGSADYRLRHIMSMSRLALRLGGSADAVELARQAVLLARRLAADHPDRWEYRAQLGVSYGDLGSHLYRVGQAQEALDEFRKSFEILDSVPGGLVANHALRDRSLDRLDTLEGNAAWLKAIAAEILLGLGRRDEAEPLLRESIAISAAAAADFPTFGANHFRLGMAKADLGQLLADSARMEEGIRLCRESLDAYDRAIELERSRPNTWISLLGSCRALGMILERTGSLAAAEEVHRRGVRYADRFDRDAHDRGDIGWFDASLDWRHRTRFGLADLLRRRGAPAEVDRLIDQIDGLAREQMALRRARLGPNHPDTKNCIRILARYYADFDRHADSLRLWEELLRLCREDPQRQADRRSEADAINKLAWLLATCPDPGLRDPRRALELAEEAVELAPAAPEIWNTLGVARHRAGDRRGAIEALAKSEELGPGRIVGFNAFFLAMAHWESGHKDEAREWYGRAVRWTEENRPGNRELLRFRAEAAGVLGLERRTDREGEHAPADAAMPNGPAAFARP
jgi:tetratricopeptide (TPR) repeat protein